LHLPLAFNKLFAPSRRRERPHIAVFRFSGLSGFDESEQFFLYWNNQGMER
jgi:hypothetical protein